MYQQMPKAVPRYQRWLVPATRAPSAPQLVPATFAFQPAPMLTRGFSSLTEVESKKLGPRDTSLLHLLIYFVSPGTKQRTGPSPPEPALQVHRLLPLGPWPFLPTQAQEGPTCPHPQICLTAALGTAVRTRALLTTPKNWWWGTAPLLETLPGICHAGRQFPSGVNVPEWFPEKPWGYSHA